MQHGGDPARGHCSHAGATEITEATCASKEVLKDLLYLLSGREPVIFFFF